MTAERIDQNFDIPLGIVVKSAKDFRKWIYVGRTRVVKDGKPFGYTHWFKAEVTDETADWNETRISYVHSLLKQFPELANFRKYEIPFG